MKEKIIESFEFKFSQVDLELWRTIANICEDSTIELTLSKESIKVRGIDRQMVCYFEYSFKPESPKGKEAKLYVDGSLLYKVLRALGYNVSFKLKGNSLILSDEDTTYQIPTLDRNEILDEIDLSALSWDYSIDLPASELRDFIKKAWFGNSIKFEVKGGKLCLHSEDCLIKVDEQIKTARNLANFDKSFSISFPMSYFELIRANGWLRIGLKRESPARIELLEQEWDYNTNKTNLIPKNFFIILSPKFEEEDIEESVAELEKEAIPVGENG